MLSTISETLNLNFLLFSVNACIAASITVQLMFNGIFCELVDNYGTSFFVFLEYNKNKELRVWLRPKSKGQLIS